MAKKKTKKKDESSYVEITMPEGFVAVFTPISIILSAIIISASIIWLGSQVKKSESALGVDTEKEETVQEQIEEETADEPTNQHPLGDSVGTVATFDEYDTDVCKEGDKPQVFLFSTTRCPYCENIKDTFDNWAKNNSDKVSAYHWQVDTGDNELTEEVETEVPQEFLDIYNESNPNGSVPTFVFGCKYVRVGNRHEDLSQETSDFNEVMKELLK